VGLRRRRPPQRCHLGIALRFHLRHALLVLQLQRAPLLFLLGAHRRDGRRRRGGGGSVVAAVAAVILEASDSGRLARLRRLQRRAEALREHADLALVLRKQCRRHRQDIAACADRR